MTRRGTPADIVAAHVTMGLSVRRAMLAHARRDAPRECCGLLVGRRGSVVDAVAMRNIARGTTRYRVDPRAHVTLRRDLRGAPSRLQIVGVYHSHPAGRAMPSPTDIAGAHYEHWLHVIVGLGPARPELRAFRISRGRIRAVALIVPAGNGE